MKKFKLFLFALILCIPMVAQAETKYIDKVYDIVGETESSTVTIYFFHQTSCPHCQKENLFLDELEEEYQNKIIVKRYEVSNNVINNNYLKQLKERLEIK